VNEAGRPIEPPLTMAPPRPEGSAKAGSNGASAPPNGIMAPPPETDAEASGTRGDAPFPADTVGRPQRASAPDGEPARGGQGGGDRGKPERDRDARAARSRDAKDAGGAGDASTARNGSAASDAADAAGASEEAGDGAPSPHGANGSRLEGGLQAVKQAVEATNNWFVGGTATAKLAGVNGESGAPRDEDTPQRGGATARRGEAEAAVRAGATAHAGVTARAASAGSAGRPRASAEPAGSSRPGRDDAYPAYAAPPGSAAGASEAGASARAGSLAGNPPAPGARQAGPGGVPDSREWTGRSSGFAVSANQRQAASRRSRRQAHLTVARVEPWSVMKFSFMVSVVAFVVLFVAIAILYGVLSSIGVFESLQRMVASVTSSQASSGTNASTWFSASRVLGYTAVLGALNIVLITAMSTIGAVIYNLISRVVGGVEITLRETDLGD